MRTTLSIDDDVLQAVKDRARHEGKTAGQVLSDLARERLTGAPLPRKRKYKMRNGFPVLEDMGGVVTNELIDRIREEEGV
jgi:hypothetical protein